MPFIGTRIPDDGSTNDYEVYAYIGEVWKTLQETLMFDYTVYSGDAEGSDPGLKSSNGMVKMLKENKLDVGVYSFFITSERQRVIDYSFVIAATQ